MRINPGERAASRATTRRGATWVCAIAVAAGTTAALPARAAMFLKLDGIDGESQNERHRGEIEITGIDQSILAPPQTGSGSGKGKVSCPALTFYKNLDASTPVLMKKLVQGSFIRQAVLAVTRSGEEQTDYYTITMQEVMVTEVTQSSTDSSHLIDKVVMTPRTYVVEYRLQQPRGDQSFVKFGWNCATTETF